MPRARIAVKKEEPGSVPGSRLRAAETPPAGDAEVLVAQLDERLENVERKLLGVNDIAKVVQRRAALLHIVHREVVLPEKFVRFVLGHGSPLIWLRG
jgi:hypothetical protein